MRLRVAAFSPKEPKVILNYFLLKYTCSLLGIFYLPSGTLEEGFLKHAEMNDWHQGPWGRWLKNTDSLEGLSTSRGQALKYTCHVALWNQNY